MIELKAKMWKNTPETGSNCKGALNKSEEAKKKSEPGHCTMVEYCTRFSHLYSFSSPSPMNSGNNGTKARMEATWQKSVHSLQKLKVYAYYNFNRQQFNGIQDAGYFLFIILAKR